MTASRLLLTAVALVLFAGFSALGYWQLERRAWKLDLIEQVDQRLAAAPVAAPGPAQWNSLGPDDEYRRLQLRGRYLHDRETFVQAMTRFGSGYWVITPLQTRAGWIVLVNRGFVDADHRDPANRPGPRPRGAIDVAGLLRPSEPDGRLLQPNRPGEDRWYSRDVGAIARARGLDVDRVAPYFIDRAGPRPPGAWPIAGLTVVKFRNAHLGYALTWFALAGMSLLGLGIALRTPRR